MLYYVVSPFMLKRDPKAMGRGVRRLPFRKAKKRDIWEQSDSANEVAERWDKIRRSGGKTSYSENSDWLIKPTLLAEGMSDLYGLKLEPMPNRLVNYGTTDNGIAVIELASDSAGAPLEGDAMGPNTYTHEMMLSLIHIWRCRRRG